METQATKRTDLMLVSPNNIIEEENFNVRQDYGDLEELMLSIVETGQLEPVSGYKLRGEDKYVLTDGHRRLKAIRMAIEKGFDIPFVRLQVTSSNVEDRIFAMVITGVGKKPLTPLEEAEAYKKLVTFGYSVKEISTKSGKNLVNIYNSLKLSEAPKKIKNAIINNEISASTVVSLIKEVKETDKLLEIVENAINNKKEGKKATIKDLNVAKMKSPIQKLTEAIEIVTNEENEKNTKLLDLLDKITNKNSNVEDIVNILRQL